MPSAGFYGYMHALALTYRHAHLKKIKTEKQAVNSQRLEEPKEKWALSAWVQSYTLEEVDPRGKLAQSQICIKFLALC